MRRPAAARRLTHGTWPQTSGEWRSPQPEDAGGWPGSGEVFLSCRPTGRTRSETIPTLIVQRGQPAGGTWQCTVTQQANRTALGSSPSPSRGRALFWGHRGARWKGRAGGASVFLLRAGQGPSTAWLAECFLPTSIPGTGGGDSPDLQGDVPGPSPNRKVAEHKENHFKRCWCFQIFKRESTSLHDPFGHCRPQE